MTHEDTGHYAEKRAGAKLNEEIAAIIREKASDNKISCAEAHSVAAKLNVSPADVGTAIDLLEIRIIKCQLGLFGYGKEKSIPDVPEAVDPGIESAVHSSLVKGRLPCLTAWEIAKRFNVAKPIVAAVCEKMNIKVAPCQLGAFG